MPAICASILEKTVEDFLKEATGVDADLVEIRADGLKECSKESVHRLLLEIKKATNAGTILTVRKKDEGGYFSSTEEARKKVILGSLHLADMADIELNSDFRDGVITMAKANGIEVIVSYHDFNKTPSMEEMKRIVKEQIKAGADYCKVAFKANTLHDVLTLLSLSLEMSQITRIIPISMGELGRISRIAAPVFGSAITYAAAGRKTAPGQLTVEETKKLFDVMGISR